MSRLFREEGFGVIKDCFLVLLGGVIFVGFLYEVRVDLFFKDIYFCLSC